MKSNPRNTWPDGPWANSYTYVRKLGKGGQGFTYLAEKNETDYVIKILRQDRDKPKARRRMAREVHALNLLSPTLADIPKFVESNIQEALCNTAVRPFVSMEYIEGKTLTDYMKSNGPLTLADAINLTERISKTIGIAHSEETFHRDIKPQNIILKSGDSQYPFVIDFGLAFNSIVDAEDDLTNVRETIGNRFLTLPETEATGSNQKHESVSDITQLVGLLFYLITKKYPEYLSLNLDNAPHKRHEDILFERLQVDKEAVDQLFDRAFQHDPARRLNTIEEFYSRIDRLKSQVAGKLPNIDPIEAATEFREKIKIRSRPYQITNLVSKHQQCFLQLSQHIKELSKVKDIKPTILLIGNSKPSGVGPVDGYEYLPIDIPVVAVYSSEYYTAAGVCRYFAMLQGDEVSIAFQKELCFEQNNGSHLLNRDSLKKSKPDMLLSFYEMSKSDKNYIKKHFNNWFSETLNEIQNHHCD